VTTLAPDRHTDRFLRLESTTNTRDLGGLELLTGGITARGHLVRSDAFLTLSDQDLAALTSLGLSTVIDLREPGEQAVERSALLDRPGVEVHHVSVWGQVNAQTGRPTDPWDITAFYVAALDHARAAFALGVRLLAEAPGAALFHCTAGKDRTGLLAALVLEAIGVSRELVIEDFALTHDRIGPVRTRLLADAVRRGVDPDDFARLLGATPDLILPALEHLDRTFGGAEAYLCRAGVDEGTLARLRTKLVP
jgi:protein-tyrosine phosphatase